MVKSHSNFTIEFKNLFYTGCNKVGQVVNCLVWDGTIDDIDGVPSPKKRLPCWGNSTLP